MRSQYMTVLFILLFAFAAAPPQLEAQSVVPSSNQNNVEQLGYPTLYTVTGVTPGYSSAAYVGRQNDSDSGGPTSWQSGSPYASFNYGIPGEFDIQATVYYSSNSGGAPARTVVLPLRHVVIARPTVTQVQGPGVMSPYGGDQTQAPPANSTNPTSTSLNGQPGVWFYFILMSGGSPIGPQLNGISAQESINNGAWTPTQAGDARFFFGVAPAPWNTYAVCDFKWTGTPASGVYPVGQFATLTQSVQIFWLTLNGNLVVQPLGTYNYNLNGFANPLQWNQTNQ